MENGMEIVKWNRYFALYDQGELVCVTVYKKGAQEVRRRIEELKAMVEMAKISLKSGKQTKLNELIRKEA